MINHYAQLTFPVPEVIVVTLSEPTVAVEPASPDPIVIVKACGYRRITIPEPPELPFRVKSLEAPPPPPPPVFGVAGNG